MFDQFLTESFFPFTLSLALLMGLLALEVIFVLLGTTLLGAGGEGVDAPEFDAPEADFEVDVDLDAFDIDPDIDGPEIEATTGAVDSGGIASLLGFGKMPAAIWLASILMAFGLTGLTLQTLFTSTLGAPISPLAAAVPSAAAAVWFTRRFGALFARLIPKTETQATSERHLSRKRGVVSQGTAARGRPAEVRVKDRFGNPHYIRAEPLKDEDVIEQGTEVLVLRTRYDGNYVLVALTD